MARENSIISSASFQPWRWAVSHSGFAGWHPSEVGAGADERSSDGLNWVQTSLHAGPSPGRHTDCAGGRLQGDQKALRARPWMLALSSGLFDIAEGRHSDWSLPHALWVKRGRMVQVFQSLNPWLVFGIPVCLFFFLLSLSFPFVSSPPFLLPCSPLLSSPHFSLPRVIICLSNSAFPSLLYFYYTCSYGNFRT